MRRAPSIVARSSAHGSVPRMDLRRVGRSGLELSRIGLGTLPFARDVDEHEGRDMLATFVEAGGNWVDTSDEYAGGDGERLVGRLVAEARRDGAHVLIATKSGGRPGETRRYDSSRNHLLSALDASLHRLDTDHVDLWQLQVRDPATPIEETLSAADHAVASGRARYVGLSNYCGWQLAEADTWQRALAGRAPLVSNQVEYSLLQRGIEREVVPGAANAGMSLIAWSPLGRGVLTGKYRQGIPADSRGSRIPTFVERYLGAEPRRVVDALSTAAEGLGISPLEVALAWVRDRPGVASAVVGPRSASQLRGILAAEDVELPYEIAEVLEEISAPIRDYPEAGWSQASAGS